MENLSNSESNFLYPKLSREEAILRINAEGRRLIKLTLSFNDLEKWADKNFYSLPDELRNWEIPNQKIFRLLGELSREDQRSFQQCLSFYAAYCKNDVGSCACLYPLFSIAGIANPAACMRLYRNLTGACSSTHGFHDWDEVIIRDAFFPSLRRARAEKALAWLRAREIAQLVNKETTQGDK